MDYRSAAAFVHGLDGQGGVNLRPGHGATRCGRSPLHHRHRHVVTRSDHSGPARPLTNVALAMHLEPKLTQQVAEIVLMGAHPFVGETHPQRRGEHLNDPEAADFVFGAECPIVMAGLDVTEQTLMTNEDLRRIANIESPPASLVGDRAVLRRLLRAAARHRRHSRPRLVRDQLPDRTAALHVGRAPDPRRLRTASVAARRCPRSRSATTKRRGRVGNRSESSPTSTSAP